MSQGKNVQRTLCIIAVGSALFWSGLGYAMDASDAPEVITMDSLENHYDPVEFNHLEHTEMAACTDCHHHTLGIPPTNESCVKCHENSPEADVLSCGDCHLTDRFGIEALATLDDPQLYHRGTPGLKGAYHLNCVGCHQEVGGPIGCEDCHTMKDAGKKMFKAGKYAPVSKGEKGGH